MSEDVQHPKSKTYYARINGCGYVFKDGTRAGFTNGVYVTDDPVRIAELDALLKHEPNFLITGEPVPVAGLPNDVVFPKDVTSRQVGTAIMPQNQTQRGMGNSGQTIQQLEAARRLAALNLGDKAA